MQRQADEGFDTLTDLGKHRKITQLAKATLEHYDLEVESIRTHSFETNLLYRVRTTSGELYVLRMAFPGWRTFEDLHAEAMWLNALASDTDIGAPRIVVAANGEYVLPMQGVGVPSVWNASLMTWVDGRLLAHHLTHPYAQGMGELFARLHIHGKEWNPPNGFTQKRFEAFLSRGEPDELFAGGRVETFAPEDKQAFLDAKEWVEREYSRLPEEDLRVIHCDLWHENIKLDHGRLRPFDFEDTIWGYRLHDIAMGMLDLLETVGTERYRELLPCVQEGYQKHLAWPEGNLEVLQIGRMLWQANWVTRFESEFSEPQSRRMGAVFRKFAHSGMLDLAQ